MATNSALRQGRAALIFGASGITGWAIAREATQYPSIDAFTRIIGLTNRPLEKESARLPNDNRIQLVSGLDLTTGVSAVTSKLQAIDGIEDVTDVYFAGKLVGCGLLAFKPKSVHALTRYFSVHPASWYL